jgi:hypothetical protein
MDHQHRSIKLTKPEIDQAFSDRACKDFDVDFTIELVFEEPL